MNSYRIGIFDTGVGGLSVLKELALLGVGNEYYYLGDKANRPYGEKTVEEVYGLVKAAAHFLLKYRINELVLACNTATAAALTRLQADLPISVLGPITPTVTEVAKHCRQGKIGILASQLTIESRQYEKELGLIAPEVQVVGIPCPGLSTFVERAQLAGLEVETYLAPKIAALKENGVQLLILGCTHYSFLTPTIKKLFAEDIAIVDSSLELAKAIQKKMASRCIFSKCGFFVTGGQEEFVATTRKLLAQQTDLLHSLQSIRIAEY
jgi:glutamate racemase